MENLSFHNARQPPAPGRRRWAIVGIVASGQLEVLVERDVADGGCELRIRTTAHGFAAVWQAVVADFVQRHPTGGLRFSINDGGARPDMVMLRLTQSLRAIEVEPA